MTIEQSVANFKGEKRLLFLKTVLESRIAVKIAVILAVIAE